MKALDTFRTAPYLHNCAQAVAFRWHRLYTEGESIVEKYAPYRGGLAPEGICGALYAAMQACPEHAQEISCEFAKSVGATHCRDIKGAQLVPCQVCVSTADRLVEKFSH